MKRVTPLLLDGHSLSIEEVGEVVFALRPAQISKKGMVQLESSRNLVNRALKEGQTIYGVTTGFGQLSDICISNEDRKLLQRNLVLSHAAGVGEPFSVEIVRAAMLLRANALVKGYSGVRTELVQLLLNCLNRQVHPVVPSQGSLGASGDLAPLAHIALVLIGEGSAEYQGVVLPAEEALQRNKLKPIVLEEKEGLALLNGTQFMGALGTLLLLEAERLITAADIIGAMSVEALLGSTQPFRAELHKLRPHAGQIKSASNIAKLLQGSGLATGQAHRGQVQDAYSLRCMPQVHGASRQVFSHLREILNIEINSATDNPLVLPTGIVSGGNFHGQPLALALDYASIGMSELGSISERRIERMVNPALSDGLPAFLTVAGGLNSGLMLAQYTAAALVSENKSLSHPASVDSIPSSAGKEDHVSMGTIAGRKAWMILRNTRKVLAIELMCAAQALDLRMTSMNEDMKARTKGRRTNANDAVRPAPGIAAAHKVVRQAIPHLNEDRQLYGDIACAEELLKSHKLLQAARKVITKLV